MKKLLLIFALLAYVAISCDDKPQTLTGGDDEPSTDTSADTCKIYINNSKSMSSASHSAFLIYPNTPNEIDFEASIHSIFRHFTITLRDGSYGSDIYHNYDENYNQVTFDTGDISSIKHTFVIDSLKYGSYCIIMIPPTFGIGLRWGPNYENPMQRFFYRSIVLNEQHTCDSIIFNSRYIDSIVNWFDPLWFEEF